MVWGCPSLVPASCCESLWRKVQYRKKCTEIDWMSLKIMGVEAPQGYKFGWNLTKVVKLKSLLISYREKLTQHLLQFLIKGKISMGVGPNPYVSQRAFATFLLLLLLFVILKVLRSNGLYHPHASVLNTTMQCWHWLYWMSVCYSEVCMLLNKWDWRKKTSAVIWSCDNNIFSSRSSLGKGEEQCISVFLLPLVFNIWNILKQNQF